MTRFFFLVLLLSAMSNIGFAQLSTEKLYKSELNLELDALSLDISFAHRVNNQLMIGIGIGGGPSLVFNDYSAQKGIIELGNFRVFLSSFPTNKNFLIEGGVQASIVFYQENLNNETKGTELFSGYIRAFYGFKRFKFGTQFALGKRIESGSSLYWTPLILRYTFRFPKGN